MSVVQWVILWDGPDDTSVFGTKSGHPFATEAAAERQLEGAGHEVDDGTEWRIVPIRLGSRIP